MRNILGIIIAWPENEMQDEDYRHSLKGFFLPCNASIETSDEPFYCFLSGGAGVGKSVVTKALYQAALKY